MREFKFKKIDAFATLRSDGNPAGYIHLDPEESMDEAEMARIARELKGFVTEVGFLRRENEDTFRLKYYSAEREVEFCGHATIAVMYDLIKSFVNLANRPELTIINNKGSLIVENRIPDHDAVFIMAPPPVFRTDAIPSREAIAVALKTDIAAFDDRYEISVVNAGLETLLVPIRSLQPVLDLRPDLDVLKNFCIHNRIDIIEVFTGETYDPEDDYRTRVFAPTFGYLEDPATGSGNAAFGSYLLKNNRWSGDALLIEQNGSADRYNRVQLKTREQPDGTRRVMFGGGAVTRITGRYLLM
jgi:PhzF family phenazine biosynthesis protein